MKQILSLLVAAMLLTVCAPAVPNGEFRIVGKIRNVPDSAVLYLYETQGRILHKIAGDTLSDGMFSFRDTVTVPKVLQVSIQVGHYRGGTLDVWVAPGECTEIRGNDKQAWLWEVASGISVQKDEDAYRVLVEPEVRELNRYQDVLNTPQELARYKELFGQMTEKTVRYLQTTPVTRVWMNKLSEYTRLLHLGIGLDHKEEMLALYDRMSEAQQHSRMGRLIDAYLRPVLTVGVGDAMADGDLYDVDGNRHRLSEFAGKYILVDFWSQGCGPCVTAVPELKEIAERFGDRLAVVSVCQDPEKEWKEYVAGNRLTGNQWSELLDGNVGLAAKYRVKGVPHFVLIAPDGRIQDVWFSYGKGSLLKKLKENIE